MALDIARAHAPGVHGDDLVVEVRPARLVLADQLGIERALAIPGYVDRQIAPIVLERLGRLAVARVAAVPAVGGMLLIAEVIGELGFQDPLGHALLHALEQAVFAEQILGVHPIFHQIVEKTVDFVRGFLSLAIALPPCEQDIRYCQLHKTCYRINLYTIMCTNNFSVEGESEMICH